MLLFFRKAMIVISMACAIACMTAFLVPQTAIAADPAAISGPDIVRNGDDVIVSSALLLDKEYESDIKNGLSKEIIFYIDLFRVWEKWPDEFVLGEQLTQTLRCDPVKKEYIATSLKGTRMVEKRFSNCDDLMNWALTIKDFKLLNTAELESSEYFVRVTVESRLMKLPPFIDMLLFFVKETEFKIYKDSRPFKIKSGGAGGGK